jgi:hypothetical protein
LKNGYDKFVMLLFSENVTSTDKVAYHNSLVYTRAEITSIAGGSEKNAERYLQKAIGIVGQAD